jgi:hypothetical protein
VKKHILLFGALACLSHGLSAYTWTFINKLSQDANIELDIACLGKSPKATVKSGQQAVIKGPTWCCLNSTLKVNGNKVKYGRAANGKDLATLMPGSSTAISSGGISMTGLNCSNGTIYLVQDSGGKIYAAVEHN